MTTLGIVGAGGHGREAHAVASGVCPAYAGIVLADDGPVDHEILARSGGLSVVDLATLADHCDEYVVAIGDPSTRRAVVERIDPTLAAGVLLAADASVGTDVACADGVMIYPGAVLTTNVQIGRHSHVNCRAVISHDCRIGAFVSVSPGALVNGGVVVEDDAFLGTGAIVLPGRRIGQGAVVAAGAVVTDDVAAGATVMGVPAR